ncbi:MAG: YkgJ family cysteine cluster protein [Bacteroidales bacterium]|nr:YkgJ family cysteine cluster protein [Bacteroidales bacterium]
MELSFLQEEAKKNAKNYALFFKKIKKNQLRALDDTIHAIHQEVFEEIDCLDCGNCCRSLGPRITHLDIQRMASALKCKAQDVEDKYLRMDEDDDYVFREMPCPFLMDDNVCRIYNNRPKACREYPHTDRKKFHQIHKLTLLNAETCPAVGEILKRLTKEF